MLLTHANVATFVGDLPYGLIRDGAVVVRDSQIAWAGPGDSVPPEFCDDDCVDLEGRLVTPGLVDCHTHLVYGGHRATEFEMRLNGASYQLIAESGGGIVSTVEATRSRSADELLSSSLPRVDALIAEGVTTIEIKSGYGLEPETEIKMLRVARKIAEMRPIDVKTTYLAAHAVPVEFAGRGDDYLEQVVLPTLELVQQQGLADAVDGFCERIAFTPEQLKRVFKRSRELGLPIKLHAEQLSNSGGTQLVAGFGGLSADHLEFAQEPDVQAMASSGTVAVLLPGAFYYLGETQLPPIELFRSYGIPMAVATDCNPGSSPLASILLAMNMSCTLFRLTPEESFRGVTEYAARALGADATGKLAPGFRADLAVWDAEHPSELPYRIGFNPIWRRMFGGQW